jgi:hypothetical protein
MTLFALLANLASTASAWIWAKFIFPHWKAEKGG